MYEIGCDSWSDFCLYRGDTTWDLKFPAHVVVENKSYHYSPKSDFFLAQHCIPRVIVEVKSQGTDDDRARMLLQGASLVRLVNSLTKTRKFVLMAVYFDRNDVFDHYLIYQMEKDANCPDGDGKV